MSDEGVITKISFDRKVKDFINVRLPYYYEHDFETSITYGKVTEYGCTTINCCLDGMEYGIKFTDEKPSYNACYMIDDKYKSTKDEFLKALAEFRERLGETI